MCASASDRAYIYGLGYYPLGGPLGEIPPDDALAFSCNARSRDGFGSAGGALAAAGSTAGAAAAGSAAAAVAPARPGIDQTPTRAKRERK